VPKPNDGVVILPGSLSLLFTLDFSGQFNCSSVNSIATAAIFDLLFVFSPL
jgi:hypothetical protein